MMTSLDRQLIIVEEMRKKWDELARIYTQAITYRSLPVQEIKDSISILTWFQINYPTLEEDLKNKFKMDYYVAGMKYTNIDPIAQLVMNYGSMEEICAHRFQDDIKMYFRTGRSSLNVIFGILQTRKERVGDINIDEYLQMKELFVRNKLNNTEITKRRAQVEKIVIPFKEFKVAEEYFTEAKSCYEYGLFRGATILTMSALESAIKIDYKQKNGEEWGGNFLSLLNRYFNDLNRLPKQYVDFTNTYVKVRNAITHPKEFEFTDLLVHTILVIVSQLLIHLEKNV